MGVAYASFAAGDVNDPTKWTPNGIPVAGDTVVVSHMMTIPANVTFNPTITLTGGSFSNRAGFHHRGVLQLTADATVNQWNEVIGYPGAVFDGLSNYRWIQTATSSTNVPNKFTAHGTLGNQYVFTRSDYVSGEPLPLICSSASNGYSTGLIDLKHVVIKNMASIKMGGGSATGNHMRYENISFNDAGLFGSTAFAGLNNDFVWKNNDYRHSHVADVSGSFLIYVGCESGAGTPVGLREYDNFTATHNDPTSSKLIRFFKPDYLSSYPNTVIDSVAVDRVKNLAITHTTSNLAFRQSEKTEGCFFFADTVASSVFIMDVSHNSAKGNFHLFDNGSVKTIEDNFIEGIIHPSGAENASDWYFLPASGDISVKRNIVLDDKGGVFANRLGASSTANVTIEHNTYLSKKASANFANPYGLIFRTESNGYMTGSSVVTILSNIVGVINNLSSDGQVAGINLSTVAGLGGIVPTDQIDVMDYNTYWNLVTVFPTNLYRFVVTTGKTIGDAGFGGSDDDLNPTMTDYPVGNSIILAFAATKGLTTTSQVFAELLKLNGFNSATGKQESGITPAFTTADIIDFAKYCVTPTNSLLATSAHDGTSRGAVQFSVAPPASGGGLTVRGLTVSGPTVGGLTVTGL